MASGSDQVTLHDYQLATLHPMCDSAPNNAARLLQAVGATRSDAAEAEHRWVAWLRDDDRPKTVESYEALGWGSPDHTEMVSRDGYEIRYARWNLTFWPAFHVELMEIPDRVRVISRQFMRRPELSRPRLEAVTDLIPWSCTYFEFHDSAALGPFAHVDGLGSIGDVTAITATDPATGRDQIYWARFDWSLLQSVEKAPASWTKYHWQP